MDDRSEDHHDIEVEGSFHGCERKISGILDDGSVGFRQPLLARNRKNTTSQIAIVGANTCPIESLDYEIFENDFFKQDWRSRKKIEILQYTFLKWALAFLIGLATGLVGSVKEELMVKTKQIWTADQCWFKKLVRELCLHI